MVENCKYNFKTLKIRPETYKKMVKCKARIENTDGELASFDKVVKILLELFETNGTNLNGGKK